MLQTLLERFDQVGLHALYGRTTGSTVWAIMVAFTVLGSGWSIIGLAPLIIARRTRSAAVALLATLLANAVVVFALKHVVDRVRPCCEPGGTHALWGGPTDPSFPSGHAAGSFACAAFVVSLVMAFGARGWSRAGALMLLPAAAMVAVSRVYLGVHYPSDVVGAAVVGSVAGIVGGFAFARASHSS